MNDILRNPDNSDFTESSVESDGNYFQVAEGQLQIPTGNVSSRLSRLLSGIRHNLRKRRDELEISLVWKSIAIPLAITTWFVNIFLVVIGGIVYFEKLPPTVPLIYDSLNNRWEQVDKSVIFLFMLFIGLAEFVLIQYVFSIFKFDKRLALTFSWIIVFLNAMLLIAILQIFSLIT